MCIRDSCLSVLLFFLPASHLDPLRNLISDCKAQIVHSDYHAVPSMLEHIDGTSLPDVMLMHKLHDLDVYKRQSVAQVLEPFLVLLNSLPKSALAPLLIVWLGNNMRTIVVAAVSVAVFGSILTLYTGFSQMDTEQIDVYKRQSPTTKPANKVMPFSWFCCHFPCCLLFFAAFYLFCH